MLIIRKNQLNKLVVTASQNRSLPNPYYLFSFTHILSREEVNFIGYIVSSNTRYDQFELIESAPEDLSLTPPVVTFPYLGQYYYEIYEQTSSTNLDPALATNEVENGRAYIIVKNDNETECLYEQYVSDNETNQNIIFVSDQEEQCLTPEPTPSMTPTNTPSMTPTMTPTLTPTASCPITTQYLEVELQENTKFKLILWNEPDFGTPATALCDYTISGVAFGDMGTTYFGTEQILQGQHQKQFDLAPVLQEGEIVNAFMVLAATFDGCICPVDLVLPPNCGLCNTNFDEVQLCFTNGTGDFEVMNGNFTLPYSFFSECGYLYTGETYNIEVIQNTGNTFSILVSAPVGLTYEVEITDQNCEAPQYNILPLSGYTGTGAPPLLNWQQNCCEITQYLEAEIVDTNTIECSLWNDSGFTISTTAECDYSIGINVYGDMGTIAGTGTTITNGQNQTQFDTTGALQPGETLTGFTIGLVNTIVSDCSCAVLVNVEPYLPVGLPCKNYYFAEGSLGSEFVFTKCDGTPGYLFIPQGGAAVELCALQGYAIWNGAGIVIIIGDC